jgi:copper chaperone NosL
MKTNSPFIILIFFLGLFSCTSGPSPINYGKDNCAFCNMTIMQPKYGAELITNKGKSLKFDSGECLVHFLESRSSEAGSSYRCFIADYTKPGILVETTKACFLHGENIESPMGGNLAGFADKTAALQVQKELGGIMMNWESLLKTKLR